MFELKTSLFFIICVTFIECEKNIIVKKFSSCDDGVDYPSKIRTDITIKNGIQYMNGSLSFNQELGDNVLVLVRIFMIPRDKSSMVKVFETKDPLCKILRKYVGPFLDDLEKAAQILPGSCPLPKGKHHITSFPINFDRIFLKAVIPYGRLKFLGNASDLKTGKVILCYEIDVDVSS